jgi:hypothetical protein
MSNIPTGAPVARNQPVDTGQATTSQSMGKEGSVQTTSFLGGVHAMPEHAMTITQLPGNARVRLMNLEEISFLARRPKRSENPKKVQFGELDYSPLPYGAMGLEFTIKGVKAKKTHKAIQVILKHKFAQYEIPCRNLLIIFTKAGAEVALHIGQPHVSTRNMKRAATAVQCAQHLLTNFLALGLHGFAADLCGLKSVSAVLSRPHWTCGHLTDAVIAERLDCIIDLVGRGHCEAAFMILADLSAKCRSKHVQAPSCLNDDQQRLFAVAQEPEAKQLQTYTNALCGARSLLAMNVRYAVQTGKMVLRELLRLRNNSNPLLERHKHVFQEIAAQCKNPKAAIAELLDLSRADCGALLRNPKARQLLLMVDPDVAKVFGAVERNASDVVADRLQRLRQEGFTFGGFPFGNEPVEIIDAGEVESLSVDLLLELAEAAVHCTGYVNWVTGVLQFLSERVLDDDQIERAAELRDLVQLAVRFHPDHEVSSQFERVRSLTDAAIREMHGNPLN